MTLPRLYPILDTGLLETRGFPVITAAQAILDAGVRMIQWRCKDLITRRRFQDAETIAGLCQRGSTLFIVNDRADLALMLGASGLHVGQRDLPASKARHLLGTSVLLGLSTHNATQIADASWEPVDYIALGPVFSTSSKENPDPVLGLRRLFELRQMTGQPVVAIGGLTLESAPEVLATGVDSLAVIGDLIPETCTAGNIRKRVEQWRNRIHD